MKKREYNNRMSKCFCCLLLIIFSTSFVYSNWQWHNPIPQGNDLTSITYGDSHFVAVGSGGMIIKSMDGTDWSLINNDELNNVIFRSVTYGSKGFIAVGDNGIIASSKNGNDWVLQPKFMIYNVRSICYGNDMYVAVGRRTIAISKNGIDWDTHVFQDNVTLINVSYCNGRYFAGGYGGKIYSSPNGEKWNSIDVSLSAINSMTYDNGNYIIAGDDGQLLFSTDAINWEPRQLPDTMMDINSIKFFKDRYFCVGTSKYIYHSQTGDEWQGIELEFSWDLNGLHSTNDLLVVVGNAGKILQTTDGQNWRYITTGIDNIIHSIFYAENSFKVVSRGGEIIESNDGNSWFKKSGNFPIMFKDIAFSNSTWIAVGYYAGKSFNDTTIAYSTNGIDWSSCTSSVIIDYAKYLECINYGNGIFVVGGWEGKMFYSRNGYDWQIANTNISDDIMDIVYGDSLFIAVCRNGKIIKSDNGISWQEVSSPTNQTLHSICYAKNIYVSVGSEGTILRSEDAINWVSCNSGTIERLYSVTYGNNHFVSINGSKLLTSQDGRDWFVNNTGINHKLYSIIHAKNRFYAVGSHGTIISNDEKGIASIDDNIRKIKNYKQINTTIRNNYLYIYYSKTNINLVKEIKISNAQGKQLYCMKNKMIDNKNVRVIDISKFSNGLYTTTINGINCNYSSTFILCR